MQKYIFIFFILTSSAAANNIQDTINYPYWKDMMQESWTKTNIHKVKRAYDLYFSNKPKEKGTGWKIFERWYENWSHIAHRDGTLPNPNFAASELTKFRKRIITPRGSEVGNWRSLGPNKQPVNGFWAGGNMTATAMSGRINTIAFHPTDSNKIWIGTPQGGLWSTTNGGQNWSSNTDNLPTLGVSTISIFPDSNKIIIGTGDRDANDAYGRGIMISRDNGSTWNQVTQLNTRKINKIAVNPQNNRTLLVATDSGLYRSYDQGITFQMVSDGSSYLDAAILDVHYKLGDSSIALATSARQFNFTQAAIYVITNTSYVTQLVYSPNAIRGILTTTAANPNIMYALFAKFAPVSSVYKIDITTATIATTEILDDATYNVLGYAKNGSIHTNGQGFYDISLCGSPTDSNFIAVGGINVFTSDNIGATWNCRAFWNADTTGGIVDEVHADHHYMAYNPLNNKYYFGTDGGIYSSEDFNTYTPLNNDLAISQFYDIDVSQADSGLIVGGLQDNANLMRKNGVWSVHISGDGVVAEVNDINPNVIVGCAQSGGLELSINQYTSATLRIGNGYGRGIDEEGPWFTPHEMNPFSPSFHIVGAKTKMFYNRKVNNTSNFKYDSIPDIQGNNFTTIRHSRRDSMMAIAADEGGSFYVLKNLLIGTLDFTHKPGPDSTTKIDDIEFNHNTSNIVYAINNKKIYKSEDTGTTWVDISGNLPVVAKYTLLNDKNTDGGIYVGTEVGVFYKDNLMPSWIMYNTNLPLTSQIRDMEIWYDTICSYGSKIYLGTFGRSAWVGDVYQNSSSALLTNFTIPSSGYKDAPIQITNTSQNIGTSPAYKWIISPNTYTFSNGTNAASASPSVIFNATGKYTLSLYAKNNSTNEYCTLKKDTVINIILNPNKVTIDRPLTNVICIGDTLTFIAKNSASYAWSPNSGISSTTDSIVKIYPSATTTYKVKGNNNDSVEFLVTVHPKPVLTVTPPSVSIVSGTSAQLTASGADTYLWTPSTGLNATTSASVIASPLASMTYTVEGTKNGCKNSNNVIITVLPVSSISVSKDNHLKIFPIPASNKLFVETKDTLEFYITNIEGKTIKKGKIAPGEIIDLEYIQNGEYFINFLNHFNLKFDFKLIISH